MYYVEFLSCLFKSFTASFISPMTAAHIIHNIKEGRKEGDSAHKNDASTPQIALAD